MTREAHLDRIGGRYRLVEVLGSGGFGRAWKAHDETLGVDVAVKEVRLRPTASDAERDEFLIRAKREARNAARLRDHPGIVPVHDVVIEDGVPWMVMRLVDGSSLADRLKERRLSGRHVGVRPASRARRSGRLRPRQELGRCRRPGRPPCGPAPTGMNGAWAV